MDELSNQELREIITFLEAGSDFTISLVGKIVKNITKMVNLGTVLPKFLSIATKKEKIIAKLAAAVYQHRGEVPGAQYLGGTAEMGAWKTCYGVIVSVRGTENIDDVVTDAGLALGKIKATKRWDRTLKDFGDLVSEFGKPSYITGHSLGGTLALNLSEKFKIPAIVFNPGSTVIGSRIPSLAGSLVASFFMSPGSEGSIIFRTPADVVSFSSVGNRNVKTVIGSSPTDDSLKAHSMSQFL